MTNLNGGGNRVDLPAILQEIPDRFMQAIRRGHRLAHHHARPALAGVGDVAGTVRQEERLCVLERQIPQAPAAELLEQGVAGVEVAVAVQASG